MDETETDAVVTVGQRLREAREAQDLSIEDIAAQTRIPTRHLASLEAGDWDKLPAATYTIGFAKNYAGAVGLDRNAIGDQLRSEMGGERANFAQPEVYEAADPARTMPKGLVFGALAVLVLAVLLLSWLNNRSLEAEPQVAESGPTIAAPPPEPAVTPAASSAGPVSLTATDRVWIDIKDGNQTLKQGELAPGERFDIPANAVAPVLTTGKPEALRVMVGTQPAPPLGVPGRTISKVSLLPANLLGTAPPPPTTTAPTAAVPPAPTQPRRQPTRSPPRQTPVASPPAAASEGGNSTAEPPSDPGL